MLIYQGKKSDFMNDVEKDTLSNRIEEILLNKMHRRTVVNEKRSWENSMQYMYKVLNDKSIPDGSNVAIEYNIPQTSKRVDFLISGFDNQEKGNIVIIELKQWEKIGLIENSNSLVTTYIGNANRQVVHPSYQAWSYAALIKDYSEIVQQNEIELHPCAYMHNYKRQGDDPIDAVNYSIYLNEAPVYTYGEVDRLRDFIKKYIVKDDKDNLLYTIDNGKIRPSKSLQDSIASMLKGI